MRAVENAPSLTATAAAADGASAVDKALSGGTASVSTEKIVDAVKKDPSLQRKAEESLDSWLRRVCGALGISLEPSLADRRRLEMRGYEVARSMGRSAERTQARADLIAQETEQRGKALMHMNVELFDALHDIFKASRPGPPQRNTAAERLISTTTSSTPVTTQAGRSEVFLGRPISAK